MKYNFINLITLEKLKNSIEAQLQLMQRFGLTANENLVIELLFLTFEGRCTDLLQMYLTNSKNAVDLRSVLLSLQEKGVLLKSCKIPEKGQAFDIDLLQFNENFLKFYRKTSGELGMELFEAYPSEAIIQGQAVPMRNFAKKFKNEEEFFYAYGRAIGWSVKKHKEVLDLIEWSKQNDHFGLNMNIADFVVSKMWISIRDHKDGSNAITFDTTVSI